jgi:tRNA-Thr(GGU) m(6)t(6)A37 methyltransferase TsaA
LSQYETLVALCEKRHYLLAMNLSPIGIIHTCYPDKFGTPRQPGLAPNATGFIEIYPQFQPKESLQGLETFSHLWIIFSFHLVKNYQFHAKVHPPLLEGLSQGLFATRSPHRPNSLGLSLVKINNITDTGIAVSELDIVDKTPVYDIKPYLPEFESKTDAKWGWPITVPRRKIHITWSEAAKSAIDEIQKDEIQKENSHTHRLKTQSPTSWVALIEETLKQDPRPLAFKKPGLEQKQYRTNHFIRIHNLDIGFYFASEINAPLNPDTSEKYLIIDNIKIVEN